MSGLSATASANREYSAVQAIAPSALSVTQRWRACGHFVWQSQVKSRKPMQYFFVQQWASGNRRDIKNRDFADLEAAQQSAIANVRELVFDALLLGKAPDDISIEIWEESGPVVSIVKGRGPN